MDQDAGNFPRKFLRAAIPRAPRNRQDLAAAGVMEADAATLVFADAILSPTGCRAKPLKNTA